VEEKRDDQDRGGGGCHEKSIMKKKKKKKSAAFKKKKNHPPKNTPGIGGLTQKPRRRDNGQHSIGKSILRAGGRAILVIGSRGGAPI